ncbi:hypothetical protein ND748_31395, partial [Frankia sp. AiPs1]|nr:hypothetical protein [Frankia sp. AiPs1]
MTTAPATGLDAPPPRTHPRASSATTAAPPPDVSITTGPDRGEADADLAVDDPAVPAARSRA